MKHLPRILSPLLLMIAALASGDAPAGSTKSVKAGDVRGLHPDRDSPAASLERGRIAFEHYCVLCHGRTGDGNGRAARLHNPRPANLLTSDKNASYKDLIVRRGGAALGRSEAMPAWNEELTEEQITDIVNFLQSIVVPAKGAAGK